MTNENQVTEMVEIPADYLAELMQAQDELTQLHQYLKAEDYGAIMADDERETISGLAIRVMEAWYSVWDARRPKTFEELTNDAGDQEFLQDFHIEGQKAENCNG